MQKKAPHLEGRTFGRLTVIGRTANHMTIGGNVISMWHCQCSCGKEIDTRANSLLMGRTNSCGCLHSETSTNLGLSNRAHGGYSDHSSLDYQIRYRTLKSIQTRAKSRGYESDLKMDDLPEISTHCPVLGIRYEIGTGKIKDSTPSIDRKNPNLPYLRKYKENLFFISYRANRIKYNATASELLKIVQYMNTGGTLRSEKSSLIDSKPIQENEGNEAQGLITQRERLSERTPKGDAIVCSDTMEKYQRLAEMTSPSVLDYFQIH